MQFSTYIYSQLCKSCDYHAYQNSYGLPCGYVGYGDLRVSDINDNKYGNLEFKKNRYSWGYVCSDGFNAAAGRVACRQLGYTYINYFYR